MKEQIIKLREGGKSYNEIVKILGCSLGTVSYHCNPDSKQKQKQNRKNRKNGIYVSKVKRVKRKCVNCNMNLHKGKKYCSPTCQQDFQYKVYIAKWKNKEEDGVGAFYQVSNHIRRYLFEKINNKCSQCGWKKINPKTKKVPLTIDHIDGDCTNNDESNLRVLCPNCHSLTENYGSLNKGNSKRSHRNK